MSETGENRTNSMASIGYRLLIIAGLAPQVITEALYLLTVCEGKTVRELKVFTTPEGKKAVENVLLLEAGNPLEELCCAYDLNRNAIHFGSDDILAIWGEGSLDEDNLQMEAADRMMSYLSQWTADEEPPLAVCVAGGRKNMGILFAQIFSLLARPADRLFHLVVSREFQHLPDFFFPTPEPRMIKSYQKGGGLIFLDSTDACLKNVEIPIVRLRTLTDETTRKGLIGFSGSRNRVQRALDSTDTQLYVNLSRLEIRYGGLVVKMPPREFALYHFFCRIRKEGPDAYRNGIPSGDLDNPLLVERLEQSYRRIKPLRHLEDHLWTPGTDEGEVDYQELRDKVVHSVSKIKRYLGNQHPARIISRKKRGNTWYSLELEGDSIMMEQEQLDE